MSKNGRHTAVTIAHFAGITALQAFIPIAAGADLPWCGLSEPAPKQHVPIETYWDVRKHREMPEYRVGDAPADPQPVVPSAPVAPVVPSAPVASSAPVPNREPDKGPLDANGSPSNPAWYYWYSNQGGSERL